MPWRVGDAIWVMAAWLLLQVAVAVIGPAAGVRMEDPATRAVLLTVLPAVLIVLTWACARARAPDGLWRLAGVVRPTSRDLVAGILYGLVGAGVITFGLGSLLRLLLAALGMEMPPVQESLRDLVTGAAAPLAVFVIIVVAPLAEELFFRGMLFSAMQERLGFWPAAIASGVVFGAVHGEPFVIVITAVLGVFLAWIYRQRGTLVVPFLAHGVFNGLGVVLIRLGLG